MNASSGAPIATTKSRDELTMDKESKKKAPLPLLDKMSNTINEGGDVASKEVKTPSPKRKITAVTSCPEESTALEPDKRSAHLAKFRQAIDKSDAHRNSVTEP